MRFTFPRFRNMSLLTKVFGIVFLLAFAGAACSRIVSHIQVDDGSEAATEIVNSGGSDDMEKVLRKPVPEYSDPVPIYIGGYEGPYEVSASNTRVSEITSTKKAEKLVREQIPDGIGIDLEGTERDSTTGLTRYRFMQKYGPLLIDNAVIDLYVDDWGNWKRIGGRYAVLTGSIAAIDERAYSGAEYRILLCADHMARTVIEKEDGKYLTRNGKSEVENGI